MPVSPQSSTHFLVRLRGRGDAHSAGDRHGTGLRAIGVGRFPRLSNGP
jgi:hypothetical protein